MADPRTGTTPAVTQHQLQTGGIFGNADNTVIYGGTFTNISGLKAEKNGFEILQEHVVPAAFYDSKQRLDPPRCHEHTREAILEDLFNWIVGNIPRAKWIAWLNGAAGAGKSAICQSIAEICIQRGLKVASFFFSCTDNARNTIDPLVATLVYQIIQLYPETRDHIIQIIESNPLIFEKTLEIQFDVLIIQHLRLLQLSNPNWQLLVIIDGVDECIGNNSQMSLIRVISEFLLAKDLPLLVLFGSRCENQLQMAFNARNMTGILTRFPLDNHYEPDEDIRRFLNDSFDEIKQTHPFSRRLSPDWPSLDHVQEITRKSSGQFIYASVVIKFLSRPSSNPSVQLDIVQGLRPSGRVTPFAQLDALYCHIFSQVDDLPAVLDFLAYFMFSKLQALQDTLYFFQLTEDDVQILLAPLTSVLICDLERQDVSFRHASLPDFLRDEKRSNQYCIRALPTRLSILLLGQIASGKFMHVDFGEASISLQFKDLILIEHQNMDLPALLAYAEATADLYASLSSYTPSQQHSAFGSTYYANEFLNAIQRLDFSDSGKLYNNMCLRIIRFLNIEFPTGGALLHLSDHHDLSHIPALPYFPARTVSRRPQIGRKDKVL